MLPIPGWPKKKIKMGTDIPRNGVGIAYSYGWKDGCNETRQLCEDALRKACEVEKLGKIIFDKEIEGFEGGSTEYISKELAQTIRQHLIGEE